MAKKKAKTKKVPAKKKRKMAKDLSGIGLEKAVQQIYQRLDPNSQVTHDEWLEDRTGNTRQYDVVIRGDFGGHKMLGIVECKDHKRKKGPSEVEGFAKSLSQLA